MARMPQVERAGGAAAVAGSVRMWTGRGAGPGWGPGEQ